MSIDARSFVLARVRALDAPCLGPMFRAMAYLYFCLDLASLANCIAQTTEIHALAHRAGGPRALACGGL